MFPTFTRWAKEFVAKLWAAVPFLATVAVLVVVVALGNGLYAWVVGGTVSEELGLEYDDCNVLGVNLHGVLVTYIPEGSESMTEDGYDYASAELLLGALEEADADDRIEAVVVEIDSPGGSPVAAEELAEALKRMSKPTVAYIREQGTSAAYWVATGADIIFASKNSSVGSIGVTQSYVESTDVQDDFVSLAVGKYKDAGNPDKSLTAEERELFMRDLRVVYENFITAVSENRGLSPESVRALADGSSLLGEAAQRAGLIDEIGTYSAARAYVEKTIGGPAYFCWI